MHSNEFHCMNCAKEMHLTFFDLLGFLTPPRQSYAEEVCSFHLLSKRNFPLNFFSPYLSFHLNIVLFLISNFSVHIFLHPTSVLISLRLYRLLTLCLSCSPFFSLWFAYLLLSDLVGHLAPS